MTENTATTPPTPTTEDGHSATRPAPRRRKLAIGAGIGAAALLVVGASAGIGYALADHDDDAQRSSATAPLSGSAEPEALRAATASDFSEAAAAALAASDGDYVSELRVVAGGWLAEVALADGSELDVSLSPELTALGVGIPDPRDGDDAGEAPSSRLDDAALEAIHAAALRAAGDGVVTEVELSSATNPAAFAATVLQADGTEVEIELSAGYDITSTDTDRPDGDD